MIKKMYARRMMAEAMPTPTKPKGEVKKETKKETKKDDKAKGEGRGRKSSFTSKKIHVLADKNPYREDSIRAKNWAKIKNGMTFEDYAKAGGDTGCLKFAVLKKHVEVK